MTRPAVCVNHSTNPVVLHTLMTLVCPTTGKAYTVDDALVAMIGDQALIWSRCAWCDAAGTTHGPDYDPAMPQMHGCLVRS